MTALQQRIAEVARRARQLVRLHGIGCFVTVVCLAALAVGATDYCVRLEDVGVRWISFGLLCLASGWGFGRFVLVAWRYHCSDLQAAWRIERRYPELGDQLTSAVAFADAPQAAAWGSAELRRTVVSATEAATRHVDFAACLDRRKARRALAAAGISLAVLCTLALVDGPGVALAAKRLLVPWGRDAWPRRHRLQWQQAPTRLAAGQDFEARLVDANGDPPARVEIQYWFAGDDLTQLQHHPMKPVGGQLVHRLANVTRTFQYRAVGGDDQSMPWTELVVVEPPRVAQCTLTLLPPDYVGGGPRQAEGGFQALIGTHVTLRGRASQPLASAHLETDTADGPASLTLALDADRQGFRLDEGLTPWIVLRSGTYGFRLVDEGGLDVGVLSRWDVRAQQDLPPTVSLKQPLADLLVTPQARVAVAAIVKDDLAVRSVDLHWLHGAAPAETEQVIRLWTGPARAAAPAEGDLPEQGGVQATVTHQWDLTLLPLMQPGEWLDFRVVATDYQGQSGESAQRRILLISREELEERVGQRHSELLAAIAEIVRLQSETRTRTMDLEVQIREAGQFSQQDIDQLQVAELNQRQVQQRLSTNEGGVAGELLRLLDELQSNRMESPELARRLRQVQTAVDKLERTVLADIQHHLIDAMKIVLPQQSPMRPDDSLAPPDRDELLRLLPAARDGQQLVIDALGSLLNELAQWDSYQRLAREVGRLKREQEELYGHTQQLRVETLALDPQALTAQQRATLKRLTQRQNIAALQFDSLTSGMERTYRQLRQDDPAIAATLADALDAIRREAVGGAMRDAGRELDGRRLGQAVDGQQRIIGLLRQLQDLLANRRNSAANPRAALLADAVDSLRGMHDRQQRVLEETRQAEASRPGGAGTPPPPWEDATRRLAADQLALEREAKALAESLSDVVAFHFALERIGQSMSQARHQLDMLRTGAETTEQQQQAAQQLQQLLDVLGGGPESDDRDDPGDAASDPAEPSNDRDEKRAVYLLAQLKLVRALQQQVNEQTRRLQEQSRPWSEQTGRLQAELIQQQHQLAVLVEQLLELLAAPQAQPGTEQLPGMELDSLERALQTDRGEN